MSNAYTYPPTRWQIMAETGRTVDETLDAHQAFDDMWCMVSGLRLNEICDDSTRRKQIAVSKPVNQRARARIQGAAHELVALVDAHRHAGKVEHLTGDPRTRALELLKVHDATETDGSKPWRAFWVVSGSELAERLQAMLAADEDDVRRVVTDLLIEADVAARAGLEVIEAALPAGGVEPDRDRLAREAQDRAERAELAALGIAVDNAGDVQVNTAVAERFTPPVCPSCGSPWCEPESGRLICCDCGADFLPQGPKDKR